MPVVEYELYNPETLEKLNLDVCSNITIEISLPVSINEDELYKYDPSSNFYNDKCFAYTSEMGTDITLNDRQMKYANNNLTLCEDNCKFSEYDNVKKYVVCNCEVKEDIEVEEDIIIDKDMLLKSFTDIDSLTNLEVIKCYSLLFKKDGLIKNIGFYIILLTIFIFIISLLIFIFKGYKSLIYEINIITNKTKQKYQSSRNKNYKSYQTQLSSKKKIGKSKALSKFKNIKENNKNTVYMTKSNNFSIHSKLLKRRKNKNTNSPPLKNIKKKKRLLNNSQNNIYKVNSISANTINKTIKSNIKINININKIKSKTKNNKLNKIYFSSKEKEEKKPFKNNINKKILDLNDYEKNYLTYNEALKYDNRTYFQYYLSLLRTKHILFLAFCPNRDYNSQIIKTSLFFFSFSLYYTINALFFTDSTIHEIHQNSGKFDFLYQLPQIIYSSIISSFINALIKYLSLTQRNILNLKNESWLKNYQKRIENTIKCLKIKFIWFYLLAFIFLIFFLFYLSCFCAVYKNTQIYLIEDTIISFALSLLYPFGLNLIPGIFRIPALKDSNKNKEFIYDLSKIIQVI